MIVACPECGGKVSTTAPNCPHCGHARKGAAAPPPIPEILEGEIVEEPIAARPAAAPLRRGRAPIQRPRRPVSRAGYTTEQESAGALVCGILGLITCPILSFVAIGIGKRGKPGWILGLVGICLWVLGLFFWLVIIGSMPKESVGP